MSDSQVNSGDASQAGQPIPADSGVTGGPGNPPPPPVPPVPGQPSAAAYPQQPTLPRTPAINQKAVISFVLSVASFLLCPIIMSIVALFVAEDAEKEIDSSNGWSTGSGFVTAAKALSWINIVLSILAILGAIAFFAAIAANPELGKHFIEFDTPTATPTGVAA